MLTKLIEWILLTISHRTGHRGLPTAPPKVVPSIPDGAIVLGKYIDKNDGDPFYVPPELASRHLLFAAGSGGGKTTGIQTVIGQLIGNSQTTDQVKGQAFVLVDARGDLADLALNSIAKRVRPEDLNGRLVWIDLRDQSFTVGFSPTVGPGDPYGRAQIIGRSIRSHWGEFGPNVQLMADNTLALFCLVGEPLWNLDNFFRYPAYRRSIVDRCADQRLRRFFADDFDALSSQKQQILAAGFLNKVNPWLGQPAARMLSSYEGVSITRLLERHPDLIVICALGTDRNPATALLGNFLFSGVLEAGMRADLPEQSRTPLKLVADEFCAIFDAEGPAFFEVLREGRRHKLSLILGLQSFKSMPANLGRELRANVSVKLYGQNSAEECAEAAKEFASDSGGKDIVQAMLSQQVGEMFAVVRGRETRQVKLLRTEAEPASAEAVDAVRKEALRAYARPSSDVDKELQERDEFARSQGSGPATTPRPASKQAQTVRHSEPPGRFAPKEET